MKRILLPLLLLFCVSDFQNFRATSDASISEALIFEADFPMALVEDNEMCKPTGVETVTYPEGKAEPAPEKKKTVTKAPKRKSVKKTQPKKA
jgi:hypothetical protein